MISKACKKLIRNFDKLDDKEIYHDVGYFAILPYISAFKDMNKTVDCCFSIQISISIDESSIVITSVNTQQCLEFTKGRGLGFWSEQSGKPIHRSFLQTW